VSQVQVHLYQSGGYLVGLPGALADARLAIIHPWPEPALGSGDAQFGVAVAMPDGTTQWLPPKEVCLFRIDGPATEGRTGAVLLAQGLPGAEQVFSDSTSGEQLASLESVITRLTQPEGVTSSTARFVTADPAALDDQAQQRITQPSLFAEKTFADVPGAALGICKIFRWD